MFSNFDYIRNSHKWFDEHKEYYAEIRRKANEKKNKLKLVKYGSTLYVSSPFSSFIGDCESCSKFVRSPYNFVEGGTCSLHKINTGYGYICKDNDSKENIGWQEFERIKNENSEKTICSYEKQSN